MAVIELTKGFVAIIDDSDFERLSQFKWCANVVKSGRAYATRNSSAKDGAKKQKSEGERWGGTLVLLQKRSTSHQK